MHVSLCSTSDNYLWVHQYRFLFIPPFNATCLFLHRYCTCPLPPFFTDSKLDANIIYLHYNDTCSLPLNESEIVSLRVSEIFILLFCSASRKKWSRKGRLRVDTRFLSSPRWQRFVFGQLLEKKCPVDPSMQIAGLLFFCSTDILEWKGRLKKYPDYTPPALLATLPKEPLTTQKGLHISHKRAVLKAMDLWFKCENTLQAIPKWDIQTSKRF